MQSSATFEESARSHAARSIGGILLGSVVTPSVRRFGVQSGRYAMAVARVSSFGVWKPLLCASPRGGSLSLGVQGATRPRRGLSPPEQIATRSDVIAEPPLPDASGPRAH